MYRLRRATALAGVGTLEAFRAIAPVAQPLLQVPQGWVRTQQAYAGLMAAGFSPEIAAGLEAARVPNVAKVWTELAYDEVRTECAPTAPSRLDSVYAVLDPLEALAFTELTGEPKQVYRGVVQDNVVWQIVDMDRFAVVKPRTPDASGFREAWTQARKAALGYWLPGESIGSAEVLVAGGSLLTGEPLRLIPTLRALGLIAPGP